MIEDAALFFGNTLRQLTQLHRADEQGRPLLCVETPVPVPPHRVIVDIELPADHHKATAGRMQSLDALTLGMAAHLAPGLAGRLPASASVLRIY